MGTSTQYPSESVEIGHIKADFYLNKRGPVGPVVRFRRLKGRGDVYLYGRGISGKGVPRLGHSLSPKRLRHFAIRLLVWAEEIEAYQEAKREKSSN